MSLAFIEKKKKNAYRMFCVKSADVRIQTTQLLKHTAAHITVENSTFCCIFIQCVNSLSEIRKQKKEKLKYQNTQQHLYNTIGGIQSKNHVS